VSAVVEEFHQAGHGSLGDFSQVGFEFGISFFDGIEVGTVGRQIENGGSEAFQDGFDALAFVAGQVIHHDGVARFQGRTEIVVQPCLETFGVHGAVERLGGYEAADPQTGDEGQRLVVAMRDGGAQTLTPFATTASARHIGRRPGFVDEDQA